MRRLLIAAVLAVGVFGLAGCSDSKPTGGAAERGGPPPEDSGVKAPPEKGKGRIPKQ